MVLVAATRIRLVGVALRVVVRHLQFPAPIVQSVQSATGSRGGEDLASAALLYYQHVLDYGPGYTILTH